MKSEKKSDIEKICAYCEYGGSLKDKDYMLCQFKGVVSSAFSCRKFLYDPLKRIPAHPTFVPLDDAENE